MSSYTGFGCDVLEHECSLATSPLLNTKPEQLLRTEFLTGFGIVFVVHLLFVFED